MSNEQVGPPPWGPGEPQQPGSLDASASGAVPWAHWKGTCPPGCPLGLPRPPGAPWFSSFLCSLPLHSYIFIDDASTSSLHTSYHRFGMLDTRTLGRGRCPSLVSSKSSSCTRRVTINSETTMIRYDDTVARAKRTRYRIFETTRIRIRTKQ